MNILNAVAASVIIIETLSSFYQNIYLLNSFNEQSLNEYFSIRDIIKMLLEVSREYFKER